MIKSLETETNSLEPIEKFYCIVFALSIFFNQYVSPIAGVSLGELLMILALVMRLVNNKMRVRVGVIRTLFVYYLVGMLLTFVSIILLGSRFDSVSFVKMLSRWMRYSTYIFTVIVFFDSQHYKSYYFRLYRWLCLIIGVYVIIQAVTYFSLHIMLPIKILPFDMTRDVNVDRMMSFVDKNYYRGFGVFLEPSYLAKFLLPSICLSLSGWDRDENPDFFSFFIVSLAMVFSTSVQGILVSVVTILMYLFTRENRIKTMGIVFAGLMLVFLISISATSILKIPMQRIMSISNSAGYSTGARLFRGFAYWNMMPIQYQLIGVGFGNVGNFSTVYPITTVYDLINGGDSLAATEYMNGISSIMVQNGLIGLSIVIIMIVRLWKKATSIGRIILIQFLLVLVSGSSIVSVTSVFFLFILSFFIKRDRQIQEHNGFIIDETAMGIGTRNVE